MKAGIFSNAYVQVSGLGRSVRGPVMSATPGKILVIGEATVDGERVFVLKMIQGRDPEWVNRIFFARFDPHSTWIDQLEPAFDEPDFFFEPPLRKPAANDWQSVATEVGFQQVLSSDHGHTRAFEIEWIKGDAS